MSVEMEVQKAFESLDRQRKDLDRQVKEKQVQIKGLASDVEIAKQNSSAEIARIRDKTANEIKELEAQVEPIRLKIAAWQDQAAQKQAVIKNLDHEIENRRADIFKLAQERQQIESLKNDASEQLTAARSAVQAIAEKMRAL